MNSHVYYQSPKFDEYEKLNSTAPILLAYCYTAYHQNRTRYVRSS
ncbi:predicted protein [Botrytis cinerea T4]|uniref:Uncharacterized protein n=1 Tax=Botryotinia fuckeliana (strain T4) TaxID=999810 RepID=G2YU00_BOTF4|nr:predicted protein [Botrytis cinerea T4]